MTYPRLHLVQRTLCPSLYIAEQPVTRHLFSRGSSLKAVEEGRELGQLKQILMTLE